MKVFKFSKINCKLRSSSLISLENGSVFVTLLYNIPTIHWTGKIYCSFVLICWSHLFIYYQNLSLILIKREIY